MNVFDWVLVALFAGGALWGYRTGLIGAVLMVASIYVAMLLSGQFAGQVVGLFTDTIEEGAFATAIGYVVIFGIVFAGSMVLARIIRAALSMLLLGWVDKGGGIALGLLAGLLLASGVLAVTARFVYVSEQSADGSSGMVQAAERIASSAVRGKVDEWLVGSTVTPAILGVRAALPNGALGMVPDDFIDALDIVQSRIDEQKVTQGRRQQGPDLPT